VKILVPRISDTTTRKDLHEFANRVLHKWFRLPFTDHPQITACQILAIKDSVGVVLRHGMLEVVPDDAAARVIRRLNGAYLCGKRVGVRHYDAEASRTIRQSQ
jgi:hypothetical protein